MKRALISVYDKTGLAEFATALVRAGWELLSTGGTASYLQENGLPVTSVADITEFPEILDGRVKTLHPRIFGGILAKDTVEHRQDLQTIQSGFIDMVVCNLYPFQKVMEQDGSTEEQCIEMIDVGGPSMVRAAAKNYQRTVVVCDPADYSRVAKALGNGDVPVELRRELAAKVFAVTALYDSIIASYLRTEDLPQNLALPLTKCQDLRYGENPHQKAAVYADIPTQPGIVNAHQIQGKELSFNNIYDADAAWQMASAFAEPCAVAVKHTNPCGWALGTTIAEAYQKAHDADPISIFGGIVAVNRTLTGAAAQAMSATFLEIIIAPEFSQEALAILAKKKNLRLLQLAPSIPGGQDIKRVSGGLLVQERDVQPLRAEQLRHVAGPKPSTAMINELLFAWTCVKFVKSNAIVVTKDRQLLGVGAGQMNRVQSMELALKQADAQTVGGFVGSDAFFPFADSIERAAAAGIAGIIEPGGSKRDPDVIAACDQHGITLLFTGIRHFRH